MPDLLALADRLEDDLHELAHRTGLPQVTLERARAAWRAAGLPGLQALGPLRAVEPSLEAFHRQRIEDWLRRELADHDLQVQVQRSRFTLRAGGRERFQLRFVPDACRWLLLVRRGGAWWPDQPVRPCLSLTDWLGQVRQLQTRARPGADARIPARAQRSPTVRPSFDTPQGL